MHVVGGKEGGDGGLVGDGGGGVLGGVRGAGAGGWVMVGAGGAGPMRCNGVGGLWWDGAVVRWCGDGSTYAHARCALMGNVGRHLEPALVRYAATLEGCHRAFMNCSTCTVQPCRACLTAGESVAAPVAARLSHMR